MKEKLPYIANIFALAFWLALAGLRLGQAWIERSLLVALLALQAGRTDEAERLLTTMDEIYNFLVTMDYPDAITNGLRRQTDLVRGIIERTRADLTLSQREQHLQEALQKFSEKFPGMKD